MSFSPGCHPPCPHTCPRQGWKARLKTASSFFKRAYEPALKDDGLRILVERLWPRGVSKQKAQIDLWLKDLAPSTELRQWYGHDPARWPQFRKRYRAELKDQGDVLALLRYVTEERTVAFVYAASDEERNSAVALKELLERDKE
jgi:uncharacterized protein YeaO (DUF488 family)